MATPLSRSIAERLSTGLVFTFVGPLIGSVAVLLFLLVMALGSPGGNSSALLPFLLLAIAMGYLFGLGPALVSGLIYALLPGALQRLALAPIYGAAAVWLFYELSGVQIGSAVHMSNEPLMLGAGAVAAFGCAWIARKSGWTPDHERRAAPAA